MLKEINIEDYKSQIDSNIRFEVLKVIDNAIKAYGKVVLKEKTIAKGKYIVIYAYDKTLYRNVIVNTIKIQWIMINLTGSKNYIVVKSKKELELAKAKEEATALGIKFNPNIGLANLLKRIEEAKNK